MVITANYSEPSLAFEVLNQTVISFSSYEGGFQEESDCAGELLSVAELCVRSFSKVSLLAMESQSSRQRIQRLACDWRHCTDESDHVYSTSFEQVIQCLDV